MGENANQGKVALMILSYLVVFGLGIAGGYYVLGSGKTSATATNTQGVGQGGFGSGSFGSSGTRPSGAFGGRVNGTVTAVDGNTITVKDVRGETQTITLTDSTTYKETDASTKDKIVVGATIAATADTSSSSSTDSSSITAAAVTVQ